MFAGDELEHEFSCPFCGADISMLLDLSAGDQTYFEDCEVCCRPILLRYRVRGGELVAFSAEAGR